MVERLCSDQPERGEGHLFIAEEMPTVDVVMERSLRRGFGGLMAASLRPVLDRRDITSQFNDVSTAFSSWDNCMNVTYCK